MAWKNFFVSRINRLLQGSDFQIWCFQILCVCLNSLQSSDLPSLMFSNFLCLFQLVMVTDFLRLQFPVLSCDDTYPRWLVLWCCEMLCKFVLTVLKSQFFNCQICVSIPAAVHSHSLTCVFLPEVLRSPVFWCWVPLVLAIYPQVCVCSSEFPVF